MQQLVYPELRDRINGDVETIEILQEEFARPVSALPNHINADPEQVEQGLAKLVLTIVELVRQLLERQAIRRIEGGSLTDEQIEKMGETFMKLEQKMEELKEIFGFQGEDLNLDLGPLGKLM